MLQIFGSGLTRETLPNGRCSRGQRRRAGQVLLAEGETGNDVYIDPARLDDRREGDRRKACVSLLRSRRLLRRRNGTDRRGTAQRDGQGRDPQSKSSACPATLSRGCSPRKPQLLTKGPGGHGAPRRDQRLHREPQGQLLRRGRHVFRRPRSSSSTTASAKPPTCC